VDQKEKKTISPAVSKDAEKAAGPQQSSSPADNNIHQQNKNEKVCLCTLGQD